MAKIRNEQCRFALIC